MSPKALPTTPIDLLPLLPLQTSRNWEVMEDLQVDVAQAPSMELDLSIPGICEGFLMKKRKYPIKGWHKVTRTLPHREPFGAMSPGNLTPDENILFFFLFFFLEVLPFGEGDP